MRYQPRIYARAFLEVIEKTKDLQRSEIMQRFFHIVRKNGDWSSMGKIFAAVRKAFVEKHGGRMVKLEFARPVEEKIVDRLRKLFSPKDHVDIAIHPRLVAGARITIDGEKEIDNSLQRKLAKLFASTSRTKF